MHKIKNRRVGQVGLCVVRLDMHKTYDRVEWTFLKDMMAKLGFNEQWIAMIMACVSSVRYKMGLNLKKTYTFTPTRGITQGEPLSPYIFMICAEALSSFL